MNNQFFLSVLLLLSDLETLNYLSITFDICAITVILIRITI